MSTSLYFYDLETSGFNPGTQRIMQFAGQRTDLELQPIGEPHNVLLSLGDDILPDPDAVLITGITPQQTRMEGITEAEFLKLFTDEVAIPRTIFVGFNSIRFDDEFMRYLHYRNFYDPYEWQWRDDRSKWDLLDMVRLTRALRPDGIKWPFDSSGKPANNLTLLTSINGLDHENAHDALSDVQASISLAQLVRSKQPKLFDFMLGMRSKQAVAKLVLAGQPFVYASGKYASETEKTTVVQTVITNADKQSALVFDLRFDPSKYAKLSSKELAEAMRWHKPGTEAIKLPAKTMKFNRCPAIAPLSVLDEASQKRLKLDMKLIEKHSQALSELPEFIANLEKAIAILDKAQQARLFSDERSVDEQLYDDFFSDADKKVMSKVRTSKPDELTEAGADLKDDRLKHLLPLYKARNFPASLTGDEKAAWEQFCQDKLFSGDQNSRLARYLARIEELKKLPHVTTRQQHLLTDLELYGQSLLPSF